MEYRSIYNILAQAVTKAGDDQVANFFTGLSKYFGSPEKLFQILVRMAVCIIFSVLAIQIFRAVWKRYWKHRTPKIHQRFLYNILIIVMYVVAGIVTLLQIPGFDDVVGKLIAGSGFLALGLGLAAQESLGNIINGMMISAAKPFEVGDRIHLVNGNITGYVEDITLRHTVIRTFINSRIIIPNSSINKEMIENSNYQEGRASSFVDVTITFDSDMDKAMELMAKAIGSHRDFLDVRSTEDVRKKEPKVRMFVRDLGINGVMLRGSMWTRSVDDNFAACSEVRYVIKKQFDLAEIKLAQIPGRPAEVDLAHAYSAAKRIAAQRVKLKNTASRGKDAEQASAKGENQID